MSNLILCTTEDGRSQIKLRAQLEMAATVKDFLTVQSGVNWPATTEEPPVVGKMQDALP